MYDKELVNDIEDILRPQMGSRRSRETLVQSALWGCDVLGLGLTSVQPGVTPLMQDEYYLLRL
jgi:hypothetical protein